MNITPKQILKALAYVDDPDLKKDIVTLGMVRNIHIEEGSISFDLVLTTPACPMKDMLKSACITSIHHFIDQGLQVNVNVTAEVKGTGGKGVYLQGVKNIIAIASGKGGVGKSNIAYTIAKVLSQSGASVGLMDADIYGPSQALLTGTADYKPESISVDGHNRMIPAEVDGVKVFSIAYLVGKSDPIAWRGPMLSSAIKQFMQDVEWGNLDYLIVDMPPGTGDVQITLAQSLALTGVVMVTTPQDIAVSDARRALMMFKMQGLQIPILGIIENMSWFETPDVPSKKYFIFGKKGGQLLSEETQTPFLGSIPIVEDLTGPSDNRDDSNTSHSLIYKNVLHITGQMVREIARVQSGKSPQPI